MSEEYFITRSRPEGFFPVREAAGCCCVFENRILLMKRHPDKLHGNTWGIPGGKKEKDEDIKACVIREIHEEAGLDINDENLNFIGSLYCRVLSDEQPVEYIFHIFQKDFKFLPTLNIGLDEHLEAKWTTVDEALSLPLIVGGKEVLEYFSDYQ